MQSKRIILILLALVLEAGSVRIPGPGGSSGAAAPLLFFDFTTGVLPGAITFTRNGTGTYNNSSNLLAFAASNVPRFNYIGGVPYLMVEKNISNQLKQSNNFTTTWTTTNSAVLTAAAAISPDGTMDAWSFSPGTGFGQLSQSVNGGLTGVDTISCWAQAQSGTPSSSFVLGINFPTSVTDGGTNLTTSWVRKVFTGTGVSGVNIFGSVNNTASDIINLFGCQLENGPRLSTYIPTTTLSANRGVEQVTFTIPAGAGQLTYTFDDNSTQTWIVAPGSYTIPNYLARVNIKSIVGLPPGPTNTSWITAAPVDQFSTPQNNSSITRGESLIMQATTTVTQMSRPCVAGNSQVHDLWLLNTSGTALAHTTVNMSDCVGGTFVWSSITPVVLNASSIYYCLSQETSGGDTWYTDTAAYTVNNLVAKMNSSTTAANGGSGVTPIGPYNNITLNSMYVGCNFGY